MSARKQRSIGFRVLRGASLFVLLVAIAALVDGCAAFGYRASGERRVRVLHSPEWREGEFHNPQPIINDVWHSITAIFKPSKDARPHEPVSVAVVDAKLYATPPASGLRVTWLGHSSTLIEIDGIRVLTDPIFSERASPFGWIGPKRFYPPPLPLDQLPAIDAVVISHDHFDHLDYGTIKALAHTNAIFIVPLGVGAHLAGWDIPAARIVELDWWQHTRIGEVEITCAPARHASGRTIVFDNDAKLWAGYALRGPAHAAYYSGDSGLFPALRQIGERLGPFDVTMIEVGQYNRAWPDWHMGPEQAVKAHQLLRGRLFIPVHWGLFALAAHGWTEPAERAIAAAQAAGVAIAVPRPGQSVEPSAPPPLERWWPTLPWKTGAEDPIVSSQMNDAN
jgi:L-ascorbate metabolism protein UlaG (beta-lactamase superfamily)